jgi:hypothetical protein
MSMMALERERGGSREGEREVRHSSKTSTSKGFSERDILLQNAMSASSERESPLKFIRAIVPRTSDGPVNSLTILCSIGFWEISNVTPENREKFEN